jgi:hypothetical protein
VNEIKILKNWGKVLNKKKKLFESKKKYRKRILKAFTKTPITKE